MACSEILKENPYLKKWASVREWYDKNKKTGTTLKVIFNFIGGQKC